MFFLPKILKSQHITFYNQMKKILLSTAFIVSAMFGYQSIYNHANSRSNGAPAGNAGNPSAGNNCYTSCHNETVANLSSSQGGATVKLNGTVVTGYYPDSTYDVTASITASSSGFGFQTAVEGSPSGFKGTLIAGAGSKITGTNYITHSSRKTSSPATWNYKWTAPSAGAGTVTFYTAFLVYNVNTFLSQTQLTELTNPGSGGTIGISNVNKLNISVYPNPIVNEINISACTDEMGSVAIYTINGELVKQFTSVRFLQPKTFNISDLNSGIYFIKVSSDSKSGILKIVKQ
ncbi:MAG: hypothetical protein RJA07_1274 [Bacteroidota bacterium]|jgi:hypothetical protein